MHKLHNILNQKGFVITVSLPKNDRELAVAAADCGADAIKVHVNVEHKASGTHFGSWSEEKKTIKSIIEAVDCPVGIMPGSGITATSDEMREAAELGIDFLDIYDYDMPVWMLAAPMTKMVALGSSYMLDDATSLQAVGADMIEASIVPSSAYRQPLTSKDLEAYRSLVQHTSLPIVVPSQKVIEPADLRVLQSIGIKGVILGTISLGSTPESFRERLPLYVQ